MPTNEKIQAYPKTENYEVVDMIGVPHPYCITDKHVVFAADNYGGVLGQEAINALERKKGYTMCGVKGCRLFYVEHEQALVVKCKVDDKELLQQYILQIKDRCEQDGFSGFVLMKGWQDGN